MKKYKSDIIEQIRKTPVSLDENSELTKESAKDILDALINFASENLKEEGDSITIPNVINMKVKKRNKRKCVNPITKESMEIPERLVIRTSTKINEDLFNNK